MIVRATKCVQRRQTVAILENVRSFPARRYIRHFHVWVSIVIVELPIKLFFFLPQIVILLIALLKMFDTW